MNNGLIGVIISGIIVISIVLLRWLFSDASYKYMDGKCYVRHGRFGKWQDLEEHIKKEHSELK